MVDKVPKWRVLRPSQEFVGNPLDRDPSFLGEYDAKKQREGFLQWSGKYDATATDELYRKAGILR